MNEQNNMNLNAISMLLFLSFSIGCSILSQLKLISLSATLDQWIFFQNLWPCCFARLWESEPADHKEHLTQELCILYTFFSILFNNKDHKAINEFKHTQ